MNRMWSVGRLGMMVIAAALIGAASARAQHEEKSAVTSLCVVGHGKISAVPDVAEINLGVVTHAGTAKEALTKNSESMTNLQKILKERGIAAKDIETTQIQISPVYSQPNPRQPGNQEFVPKVVGYRVVNAVQVTVREIGKLGDMLDVVVDAGANQVNGISFRVDKTEGLLDEARKRAMADAKRKAELLAGEAGVVLGPPRQIVEAGGEMPRPLTVGLSFASPMRAASAPVAAGEQELSVSIQVSYEIMPPKR